MNTLDDLRATLAHEAGSIDDHDRYARPVAVRRRIRAARQRRAALAASAAVLAVVAGTATVASVVDRDDSVQPASRLFGVDVPERVSVYGFPYELEDTTALDGGGTTDLSGGDHDLAVSLVAAGLGGGSATLYVDGQAEARAFGDDAVELPVPAGDPEGRVRVRVHGAPADAHVGVAVYRATGQLPAGVADGRVVFPQQRAGDTLLAGAFAEPGESSVTLHLRAALDDLRFSEFCGSQDHGLWINVSVDGDGAISGQCHEDPATTGDVSGSWYTFPQRHDAVREHTVRAYLTRGSDGPEVAADDARLGVAVYERGSTPRRVLGADVEPTVEEGGRTWRLEKVVVGDHAAVDTGSGDRLLAFLGDGDQVWATWRGSLGSDRSTNIGNAPGTGPGFMVGGVLLEGDRYDVRLRHAGAAGQGALLVYRPE